MGQYSYVGFKCTVASPKQQKDRRQMRIWSLRDAKAIVLMCCALARFYARLLTYLYKVGCFINCYVYIVSLLSKVPVTDWVDRQYKPTSQWNIQINIKENIATDQLLHPVCWLTGQSLMYCTVASYLFLICFTLTFDRMYRGEVMKLFFGSKILGMFCFEIQNKAPVTFDTINTFSPVDVVEDPKACPNEQS